MAKGLPDWFVLSGDSWSALQDRERDLVEPGVLTAVWVLRAVGEGPVLDAARACVAAEDFGLTAADAAGVYRVDEEIVRIVFRALAAVEYHYLDERLIAGFADHPLADGAVAVIAAAGLSAEEAAGIVAGRVEPDLQAVGAVAALRGYRLSALDASGEPARPVLAE